MKLISLVFIATLVAFFPMSHNAQPADDLIYPGKGWKTLKIGATRTSVEAAHGKPEITTPGNEPGSGFATYTAKGFIVTYGPAATIIRLSFIGDGPLYGATSIKFGSFIGKPAKGLTWGTTEAKVLAAYGPSIDRRAFVQNSTKLEVAELIYPGAEFIFKGNKLFHIKITPITTVATAPKPVAATIQSTAVKRTKDGRALFDAVIKKDEATVQALIAGGSIIDFDLGEDTTLREAIRYRQPRIAKMLLEAGADPNFTDSKSRSTSVMMAAQMNDDDTMALLVNTYRADVNRKNSSGYTALHTAAIFSNANGTRIMLSAGANPHVLDDQGRTPLDIAKANGANYVVNYLQPVTDPATVEKLKAGFKPATVAATKPAPAPTTSEDDDFYNDMIMGSVSSSVIGLARKEGFRLLDEGETTLQGRNSNSEVGAPKKFVSKGSIYQFVVISKDVQTINAIMNGTLLTMPCDECRTSISTYWTSIATTKSQGFSVVSLQFSLLNFQNNSISLIPKAQVGGGNVKWMFFSKPGK